MNKCLLVFCGLALAAATFAEDTLDSDIIIEEITGDLIDLEDLSDSAPTGAETPELIENQGIEENDAEVNSTSSVPAETEQSPNAADPNVKVNVVNVSETFFRLDFNSDTNIYTRTATNEAKPGDLIEIVINAVNASDETVTDVELINSVPQGPLKLVENSFQTDLTNSLYRISRNGQTFFPADAGLDPNAISFVQWVIFSLSPGQQLEFKYRIRINQ